MRKETRSVDVFIAIDGEEFTNEEACLKHDDEIVNTKYFRITCQPDLTEGRGYHKRYFLKCAFGSNSEMIVEEYCHETFGRAYEFVMGVIGPHAIMRKYCITEVTIEKALEEARFQNQNNMCKLERCVVITLDDNGCIIAERQNTFI